MIGLRVPAAGGHGRTAPDADRTGRAVDGAVDAAVLLFAVWTVVYHAGLLLRPPTWALLACWLGLSAAAAAAWALRGRGDGPGAGPLWPEPAAARSPAPPRALALVAVVAGIVAGACAGLQTSGAPWWCAWTFGLVSAAASAACLLLRRRFSAAAPPAPDAAPDATAAHERSTDESPARTLTGSGETSAPEAPASRRGTPLALATAAGFSAASLFVVNSDGDDAYFVSRSVATAALGRIPFKDAIFTSGTAGPVAGEPPVSSIEVLAGSLARIAGVPAASFVYYVLLPVVTFIAVWAAWRLSRAWAPRRAAACFAVAAVYLLWSGLGPASLGSFHLLRMWQGKAVMVSALIPLLYVRLTRWAERRRRRDLVMLAACGVAATGLTSSAAFVLPLAVGAAAVPLIASGRVRTGLAACVALTYPIAAGAVVTLQDHDTTVTGFVGDASDDFRWVLLYSAPGVLAGCALWLAPWTARRGVPALIGAGVAAVIALLLVPGVLRLAADATGAGQVLWRTMWVVPAPVLIGLLATVRVPVPAGGRRAPGVLAAALPAAALAVTMVVGGTPLWSAENGSFVASRPSWKLPPGQVGTARRVVDLARTGGVVVMPQGYMRAVPLLTARVHAANPNGHYLRNLPVPARFATDRQVLTAAVRRPGGRKPALVELRGAIRRAGVAVACAHPRDLRGLALLEKAGLSARRRVGRLVCLFSGEGPRTP
ncbi:hypothetical protein F8568_043645 [Actinomadura sp. LD22]|uniref:Glycosyltransferase RgtA/B/C/D-like domain-containing protein n=1 Tax=Actinomadura physcomitrii TaxID=2650748 RepID=A0A6I4MMF0_9ACTN|nr:DUF6077 domain-containing protein [Actinomadura physcomitrii]MWA05294.1 hypothetical protein [Actinomadura physcomitrii]MWA07119.1 hypothetical protein [Actinomadura physcomitrii]